MDVERELRPFRNLIYAGALFTACAVAILVTPSHEAPSMHTFFDAGIVVVSGVLALLLWDLGWRTNDAPDATPSRWPSASRQCLSSSTS